jgi:hypothetical protein
MQHYTYSNNTTSLFVVFDWPIQRRTDWAVSFSRILKRTIVLILVRKDPCRGQTAEVVVPVGHRKVCEKRP